MKIAEQQRRGILHGVYTERGERVQDDPAPFVILSVAKNPVSLLIILLLLFSSSVWAGDPVHAALECTDCHSGAVLPDHNMGEARCEACHADVGASLEKTGHGRAFLGRFKTTTASCLACHGEAHEIRGAEDPASWVAKTNQPKTCGACHEESSKVPKSLADRKPASSYLLTVHGEALASGELRAAACTDCHGAHTIVPPTDPGSKIAHQNIVKTCGQCHAEEAAIYQGSVHGKALAFGVREAPTCTDCHGEHTIRMPSEEGSSAWKGAITKTCSGCHASEKITLKFGLPPARVQTFLDSFHGLAGRAGDLEVANCASCHGWHDVLASSDPRSRIHPDHLAETCGQCHPNAGALLTTSKIHASLSGVASESSLAGLLRTIYLILIPVVIGGMLLHNLLDFLRKAFGRGHTPPAHAEDEILLTRAERIQHGWLVLSFVLLAYSGFALEYPESFWAAPFRWLGGEELRRNVHRVAALIFVLISAVHVAYLGWTVKGRERFRALLPEKRDLSDPIQMFLYNLGLMPNRPLLKRFSYIEKAEYWALVWGSFVMVATGVVLLFHNFALAQFPLWVIEVCQVVHFLEATLACLAIVVWHFYWVMFDPEVYPINWAWLSGKKRL